HGDDARYRFVDPTPNRQRDIWRCGNCHKNSYAEWNESRHSLAARNVVTRAVYRKDFLPALADKSAAGDPGLCTACHAPEAALDGRTTRLDEVAGTALLGNHCDFCHKVHHTETLEAPGVRGSLRLGRPAPDDESVPGPIKRVYGPLADSDYLFMGAVHSPFFATSALCAGCHQYTTLNGIPAYDTYAEWRAWASGRRRHESCQSCHMPTGTSMEGRRLARRICINALRRPQEQIHDHGFLGRDLASTAVDLEVHARREGERVTVTTKVTAVEAGHRVPTGSGNKHLLLVVLATDGAGRPYALVDGARIPAHAGGDGDATRLDAGKLRGRLAEGDFAGMPGTEFAQVLADAAGRTHVPFWRAVRVVEDSRLVPGAAATVRHVFAVGGGKAVTVEVEVWHRLRYKRDDVARDVKGPGVRPLDLLVATSSVDVR
ncbi:MAG: multiheme c-type cytochrome, partial [Planctomycetota bacterium]